MTEKEFPFNPANNPLKSAAHITVGLVILLLAGSLLFYKERMLFLDAPFILSGIMNDNILMIAEHRYGAVVSQIIPYLALKLHLSLRAMMMAYSVSFYLFFLAVIALLVKGFKTYHFAILFGLYLTLFVSDTYYWPNNEVHQGIGWLMLACGLNYALSKRKLHFAIAIIIFTASFYLALLTHPLVMIPAVYLWFFCWGSDAHWPYSKWQSYFYSAILLVLCYIKYYLSTHGWYDQAKLEGVSKLQIQKILQIPTSPHFHFFFKNCLSNYWLLVLIFIAGLVALIKERKYILVVWTSFFTIGYLILIFITFWDATSCSFYLESEYTPLSIICSAPFVYYILPKMNKRTSISVMILICSIRIVYIYNSHNIFTNRVAIVQHIEQKMKEKGLTKVIIPRPLPQAVSDALMMDWAAPVESLFLSEINGEKPQRTFIFTDSTQVTNYKNSGKAVLLGSFDKRVASGLNYRYFTIDTTVTYQVLTYSELMQ